MDALIGTKSKPLWQSVTIYSTIAAFLLAGEKAIDSIVSNKFLMDTASFTAASSYLLIGSWFAVAVSLILILYFGNYLHKVKGINLNQPAMFKPASYASIAGVVFTFVFLLGLQYLDLQLMYALTVSYILFIILYEWRNGKIPLAPYLWPGALVVIGSVLASYNSTWLNNSQELNQVKFFGLCIVVFLFYNSFFAVDQLNRKVAVDVADPMNVQLLRSIVFAVTSTILVVASASVMGNLSELVVACMYILRNPSAWLWLLILFGLVTIGLISQLAAQKESESVSPVITIVAGHLPIGITLSILLDTFWPGAAGTLPTDGNTWAVRITGNVILCIGILGLLIFHTRKSKHRME